MSVLNGLPAHVLLVHFVVVLAPLTALLVILCALVPAIRRRLTWLTLVLAVVTLALTPLTTEAGEWLEKRVKPSEVLESHAELGDTMLYFSVALLVAAALVAFVHVRQSRGGTSGTALQVGVVTVVLVAAVATTVQVYRIGDSGARAVWKDKATAVAHN